MPHRNLSARVTESSVYQPPAGRVTYNLRYFLPHPPLWGPQSFCEQRLEELLAFCRRAAIDAVQFYVNTLPGTYYMPARSAAEQQPQADWMTRKVIPALRAAGISYQLNFQMLLGASTHGIDMRAYYGWEPIIDSRGRDAQGVACPIGPQFRERMGQMLRLWAATRPDVLWIDDDFRLHNHGLADGGMDYYCYCDLHLAGFAQGIGEPCDRRALVAEISASGKPSPRRAQWLAYLGRTMTDTAAWIRQQVAATSPDTRVALMTSVPEVHAMEGRNWGELLSALSGPHRPMTRPCSGVYTGTAAPIKAQTCTYALMAKSMVTLERIFGRSAVDFAPELENTRYTTWSKSVANSRYVLMLAQLLGTPHVAMSLHDLDGSALNEEPTTMPMLAEVRPRLEALAGLQLADWQVVGATMLVDPDAATKISWPDGAAFHCERPWEDLILQAGLPVRFALPDDPMPTDSVRVLDEYAAWCLSGEQVIEALGAGVLLDADAAHALQQRGFGEHLGVHVGDRTTTYAFAEAYEDAVLPGIYAIHVPLRCDRWRPLTPPGRNDRPTTAVSWFIDTFNHRHVGSTIHENRMGGRVAVLASIGEMRHGTFFSHARVRWLRAVLRWLSFDRFAVMPRCTQHGLTIVRRRGDRWLIAHANLGSDCVTELTADVAPAFAGTIKVLDEAGRWVDAASQWSDGQCRIPCRLYIFDWCVSVWKCADKEVLPEVAQRTCAATQ